MRQAVLKALKMTNKCKNNKNMSFFVKYIQIHSNLCMTAKTSGRVVFIRSQDRKDWEKKDFEITLPDKKFNDKGKAAAIRPAMAVDADSEICLDNFSGQIESLQLAKPVKNDKFSM
jgi:hypothetical protein